MSRRIPDAAGYHEWAWRAVFERAFGHECRYLFARRGPVVGVLPLVEIRSAALRPFVDLSAVCQFRRCACGVATRSRGRSLTEAGRLAKSSGCKHVELRHIGRRFDDLPCRQHKVTMRLPLRAGMWDRIDRKARNQVRKAEKSGLTVTRGGAELLGDFYTVFARNMRDLGTPVYARRLFDEVARVFPERARVIVVRLKDAPVAAGFTYRTRQHGRDSVGVVDS